MKQYSVQNTVQIRRPFFSHYFGQQNQYGLNQFEYPFGLGWTHNQLTSCTPHADVLEMDDQYIIEVALPGVVLDDVELKVEENLLTVVAKRTPVMFEERAAVIRKELPAYLVRHFEFESIIIHDRIEARLDRGILYISVPKLETAMRVPVSAGTFETRIPSMKTRVGGREENNVRGKEIAVK
jgi:HSP20 family protein